MRYLESVGVLTGQFEEQLGELKTGRSRTLNVGMTLWRGSVLLPDILPSYSESHPDVRITLREHHTAQLSKLLQEDQIDFALMNMPLNLDDFEYGTKGCPIHHQQYDFGQPGGKRIRHHLPPGRRNPPHCPRGAACILHRRQSTFQRAAAAFI